MALDLLLIKLIIKAVFNIEINREKYNFNLLFNYLFNHNLRMINFIFLSDFSNYFIFNIFFMIREVFEMIFMKLKLFII